MTMLSLRQTLPMLTDAHLLGDGGAAFERVCTDSRQAQPGDLFVALKGERFDAHDFLPDVVARGVTALLVTRAPVDCPVPVLQVPDTRIALGELAAGWRRRFTLPVVAVTGSNGKTTVKEMIAAIFAAHVGEADRLATAGNFNNDIGLPLTLLRLAPTHRLAVLELGMNHPGETTYLAGIAQPTIGLVNNAQREHQEFMVNVEAVAREHASVIDALPPDGAAVFPADSPFAPLWRTTAGARRVLDFALGMPAAINGHYDAASRKLVATTPAGMLAVTLPVLGAHNACNALAATACALAAGVPLDAIADALGRFVPVKGRLQARVLPRGPLSGAMLVDDTYNANPDSVRAAIDVLASLAGPRVLVLGDMGEVGSQGDAFHREVGAYARERGIEHLLALGAQTAATCAAFGAGARHFDDADALGAALSGLTPVASILVKGSRFMRMERIVAALDASAHLPPNDTDGATAPRKETK